MKVEGEFINKIWPKGQRENNKVNPSCGYYCQSKEDSDICKEIERKKKKWIL